MTPMSEILAVAAAAGFLTLGLAVAEARDLKVQRLAEATTLAAPLATEKAEDGRAAAAPAVQSPACARKVKVVYAGYGEGERAGCPATAP